VRYYTGFAGHGNSKQFHDEFCLCYSTNTRRSLECGAGLAHRDRIFARLISPEKSRLTPASDTIREQQATGAGSLHKYEGYRSQFLPAARDLIVYIPGVYDGNPLRRFPVLYLQDGQNLFDPATSFAGVAWRAGETADRLIAEGRIQPLVMVGIYNTGKQRLREYTPSRAKKLGGGGANRYGKMLVREIMPFIESKYRVSVGPAHAGVGGSSLGGLLALYLGLSYPGVFGKVAAVSPSVWWNQRWILDFAAQRRLKSRPRIWLDTGTQEGTHTTSDARRMRDALVRRGWQEGRDLHYEEIPGGQHNEAAWAQRVGPFLQFLFPAREGAV
jgi:enterochelin esterase-like enzyme